MRYNPLYCVNTNPLQGDFQFPTRWECQDCEGRGYHNRKPHWYGLADPEWSAPICDECDGLGYVYSPNCKVVRRYHKNLKPNIGRAA